MWGLPCVAGTWVCPRREPCWVTTTKLFLSPPPFLPPPSGPVPRYESWSFLFAKHRCRDCDLVGRRRRATTREEVMWPLSGPGSLVGSAPGVGGMAPLSLDNLEGQEGEQRNNFLILCLTFVGPLRGRPPASQRLDSTKSTRRVGSPAAGFELHIGRKHVQVRILFCNLFVVFWSCS